MNNTILSRQEIITLGGPNRNLAALAYQIGTGVLGILENTWGGTTFDSFENHIIGKEFDTTFCQILNAVMCTGSPYRDNFAVTNIGKDIFVDADDKMSKEQAKEGLRLLADLIGILRPPVLLWMVGDSAGLKLVNEIPKLRHKIRLEHNLQPEIVICTIHPSYVARTWGVAYPLLAPKVRLLLVSMNPG
jgi:hypothetical protein